MTDIANLSGRPSSLASNIRSLAPLMLVVLVVFLVTGFAVPVLPLHVHGALGFGTFVVGMVTGSQFIASVLSRVWSGHLADSRGAKRAIMIGLCGAVVAGGLYGASLPLMHIPAASVAVLLAGRALLGIAESLIITGAVAWGLALVGPTGTGRVIAWVGMAMFTALACGAPLGSILYGVGGLGAVAAGTALVPLAAALLVLPLTTPALPREGKRPSLRAMLAIVWLPGAASALSSIGFGAVLGFGALLTVQSGWTPAWAIFTSFAVALVLARLFFGHLPDRHGGARIALLCAFIEAGGLALISVATGPAVAAVGAALTGLGYSLVYPALGIEAVGSAPLQARGLAMGAYTVFLDVALGLGTPALGLIGGATGLHEAFLAATLAACLAALLAFRILTINAPTTEPHR